jgi:triacylglycerol lipase
MLDISTATLWAVERARGVLLRTGRARSTQCFTGHCDCGFGADFARPFPADKVRMTSIYSKQDGVVHWRAQVVPYADCVEVTGSHVGLVFNRKAYRAIAAALAQPELGYVDAGRRLPPATRQPLSTPRRRADRRGR